MGTCGLPGGGRDTACNRKTRAEEWIEDERGDSDDDGTDYEAENLTKARPRRQSSR